MPLDPQCARVIEQLGAPEFDWTRAEPEKVRAALGQVPPGPVEPVERVEERSVPGPDVPIPVRIYRPAGDAPLPTLVYFHGGGFVICSLDTHDGICRKLANAAGCAVVSVDYRLAPETAFPGPAEDCYAATTFVARHGAEIGLDPGRLAVGGDSAGGNLAAVTALMARDRGGPPLRFQLLVYPVTDRAFDTDSYRENGRDYFLSADMMRWFWGHYLEREEDASHPYASPLRAPDLSGLPPALVITAEYDPLRDEGDAYAARLREAGVAVRHSRYPGMIHGFFGMGPAIDAADRAVAETATALRTALA